MGFATMGNHRAARHRTSTGPDTTRPSQPAVEPGEPHRLEGALGRVAARNEEYLELLSYFPATVDLGEQVNGSDHLYDVVSPLAFPNATEVKVTAAFARRVPWFAPEHDAEQTFYDPRKPMHPLRVRFAPTHNGAYEGQLNVELRWNGQHAYKAVRILARSRDVAEAPWTPDSAPASSGDHEDEQAKKAESPRTLEDAADDAKLAAENLADALLAGLALAEKEIESYKQMVVSAPWWSQLAMAAISSTMIGLAGYVTTVLGSFVMAKLAQYAPAVVGKLTQAMKDGATEMMQDLFATALQAGLDAGLAIGDGKAGPARGMGPYSSNPQINFFTAQRAAILEMKKTSTRHFLTQKREYRQLGGSEEAGAALVAASAQSLSAAESRTPADFARNVEQQWMVGLARQSAGTESVDSRDSDAVSEVTNMRGAVNATAFDRDRGILEIRVSLLEYVEYVEELERVPIRITAATVKGVSQEVADQLHVMPLIGTKIPIIIHLDSAQANTLPSGIITRDEAGRVRTLGRSGGADERQQHRGAVAACNRILGTSLRSWGLGMITTDDGTGRGDK